MRVRPNERANPAVAASMEGVRTAVSAIVLETMLVTRLKRSDSQRFAAFEDVSVKKPRINMNTMTYCPTSSSTASSSKISGRRCLSDRHCSDPADAECPTHRVSVTKHVPEELGGRPESSQNCDSGNRLPINRVERGSRYRICHEGERAATKE